MWKGGPVNGYAARKNNYVFSPQVCQEYFSEEFSRTKKEFSGGRGILYKRLDCDLDSGNASGTDGHIEMTLRRENGGTVRELRRRFSAR